jgi:2Fe-2S ferredoxin
MFGLCGGALACVTCHVYADESTASRCTPMQDFEDEMLDGTVTPRQSSSRLSCQIVITEDLEGGTFTVPDKNY